MTSAAEAVPRPQDRVITRQPKRRRDWAKLGLGTYFAIFLVFLGAWSYNPWVAAIATFAMILAAGYLLWMFQRLFFGEVTEFLDRSILMDRLECRARPHEDPRARGTQEFGAGLDAERLSKRSIGTQQAQRRRPGVTRIMVRHDDQRPARRRCCHARTRAR